MKCIDFASSYVLTVETFVGIITSQAERVLADLVETELDWLKQGQHPTERQPPPIPDEHFPVLAG